MRAAATALEPRLWREVAADCQALADGTDILTRPLWATDAMPESARRTWDKVADSWQFSRTQSAFWVTWVRAHLDGQPLPTPTVTALALLDNALWEGDRAASRAEIDRITGTRTAVAKAFLFDFEVHAQLLRVTGVPLDFNGMSEAEIEACLQRLRDWSDDLKDWQGYVHDRARTTNEPSSLLRAAGRITALIDGIGDPKHFPAGRLVTIGSDLRRLAADAGEREKVGDTLAAMLDERIDDLTALLSACFGRVLSRIEALNELDLGDNEPAAVIEKVRKGLETLRTAPPDELVRLDAGATAAFAEMLRELEELEAAIEGAQGPKQVDLLKRRFAQRVGGTASTLGRAIEAGRKAATKAISRFDNVVNGISAWTPSSASSTGWTSCSEGPGDRPSAPHPPSPPQPVPPGRAGFTPPPVPPCGASRRCGL